MNNCIILQNKIAGFKKKNNHNLDWNNFEELNKQK